MAPGIPGIGPMWGSRVAASWPWISARERVVCPGFIDTHAHSDWLLLDRPTHEPKVMQGVTTELLGQDGFSLAPLRAGDSRQFRQIISGMHGDPDVAWTWTSFEEYLDVLQSAGPSVNAGCLVGHGTLRFAVMGMGDRRPTGDELSQMKALLRGALDQGALGLSTGLLYAPCYYAPDYELVELCQVAAEYGGMLVVHLRSEGDRLLESIEEMLDVSRRSGVSLHISHFKVFGRENWGKSASALGLLEEARRQGLDVTVDQYPYVAGSTGLVVILPPWANDGGTDAVVRRLADPEERERIRRSILDESSWDNFMRGVGADKIRITWVRSERNKWAEGKTIAEAAAARAMDPLDFALDLLRDEKLEVSMVNFSLTEEDVRRILAHPLQMVCTDAILLGRPHPRAYGAYPRILGRYVREEGLLPLEQAIRKMTSFPAQRLRLRDRGILRAGAWADVVIFDPTTIVDRATFEEPIQYPAGIDCVIVNGQITVRDGAHQGARAGRVLRRQDA